MSEAPSDNVDADVEYHASGSEEEDETTIAEQEEMEGSTDAQAELDALQQEGLAQYLCTNLGGYVIWDGTSYIYMCHV